MNPALLLADERVQALLPPEHFLAYVNLLAHATMLNATTGSEYVDGEFSCATALKRVRHLTPEALDTMFEAELVEQLDGDLWRIDFTGQTAHAALQARADANAARSETQRSNYATAKAERDEAGERLHRRREQDAQRAKAYRERKTVRRDIAEQVGEKGPTVVPATIDRHDHSADEKCGGCERFMCDECIRSEPGINWSYAPDGNPWCSECKPSKWDKPKPECWKCDKYGNGCNEHGIAKHANSLPGKMEDEFVGATF